MKNLSPSTTSQTSETSDSRIMSAGSQWVLFKTDAGGVLACAVVFCCVAFWCVAAWCMPVVPIRVNPLRARLADSGRSLGRVPAHISEFNPVSEPLALPRCGNVRPPEALLTPDPLLPAEDEDVPVRVSFIVGSDGHVHSAFVLNGAGPDEDAAVLRAVRQWRYRPALCNGVPTDSEARVRFILR